VLLPLLLLPRPANTSDLTPAPAAAAAPAMMVTVRAVVTPAPRLGRAPVILAIPNPIP